MSNPSARPEGQKTVVVVYGDSLTPRPPGEIGGSVVVRAKPITTMKNATLYALLCLCLHASHLRAEEFNPEEIRKAELESFYKGEWVSFSTKDNPKTGGLNISLKRPKAWILQEGERPHIVQKIAHPSGFISALLTIRTIVPPNGILPTEKEILSSLSPEEMKKSLPPGYTVIDAESTTVDGRTACVMEYTMIRKAAGVELKLHLVDWTFIYKSTMIHFVGSVGGLASQDAQVSQATLEMIPVFMLMANSIVVQDQWK